MKKRHALMIFLSYFLLLLLFQTLDAAYETTACDGTIFNGNSSYAQNRRNLFSSLGNKVVSNGGFYNASLGENQNRVHALAVCARGYDPQTCISCVEKATQEIQTDCPNRKDSFKWGSDYENNVSCLVRSSNQSLFRNLELQPVLIFPSPQGLNPSTDMTLFTNQWDAMVNRTLKAAIEAETSLVMKYYSAEEAEFTEFSSVYMLMQCTPDITSQECRTCLEECVTVFEKMYWGRQGGEVCRPSCDFRWDLYAFNGAFDNATRVPAPPRPPPQAQEKGSCITDKKGKSIGYGGIIAIIVTFTFINLLVFIGFIKVYAWRRKSNNRIAFGTAEYSDSDGQLMLRFDLPIILFATNDFSSENTLGQGGFGTVYKGILPNGQVVAVKRLTIGSVQGNMHFMNEVSLLTRLQHRNLVKLLGFCNEKDEEVLVYEFVPNSSLDNFIFDEEKRSLLTWEVRCKIIEGIARGLLYLHEDSHLKIIHRDLKASNILLDEEMNPKIADFGTARLFDSDETRAETIRISGTRGYMAPEYINHGEISVKSDVYSFGVLLLEIISGKRNKSFEGVGLAASAWKKWVEGKPEIMIDDCIIENPRNEIIKVIQIGLLCVQENATKRPTMSSVINWLGSENTSIPLPNAPAFTGSHSQDSTMSMRDVFTELSCR